MIEQSTFFGEFDPGSGRTLAACLIHASRADRAGACFRLVSGGRVSNTWDVLSKKEALCQK
ncbi:hypothetical protein DV713_05100 [Parageobacillus thermoglucosidasius]|nr:hypothetical protein DV713_05100 [Parageobacillus thermoglucosidasius]